MKIQEMRSGILHLNKRMENERRENFFETRAAGEAVLEAGLPSDADCELEEPCWSVVSFDQREAGGMTYNQAAVRLSDLDSQGVAGLCIITDDAATRLRG